MINAALSIREYGGYFFVMLGGELDVSDAASAAAALTSAAARNPRIIVDLAALEFTDCSALGSGGSSAYRHVKRANQPLGPDPA